MGAIRHRSATDRIAGGPSRDVSPGGPPLARLGALVVPFPGLLLAPPIASTTGASSARAVAWTAPAAPVVADGACETDTDPDSEHTAKQK
jgi:hypothetical protein